MRSDLHDDEKYIVIIITILNNKYVKFPDNGVWAHWILITDGVVVVVASEIVKEWKMFCGSEVVRPTGH